MVGGLSDSQYVQRASYTMLLYPRKAISDYFIISVLLLISNFARTKANYTSDKWLPLLALPSVARMESAR